MMRGHLIIGLAAFAAGPALAQSSTPSMTLYELPGYLGRSVTVTSDTPDLATETFAKRAQSARVSGSWQVCPAVKFAGACRTLTDDVPFISKSKVISIRPTPTESAKAATAPATTNTQTSSAAAIDLDALDVGAGTEGQDVSFYPRPSLGGTEIAAGTNDIAAATAFCKLAGGTSASYGGRARVQTSNLVDIAAKTKVRSYALRDVVCKK